MPPIRWPLLTALFLIYFTHNAKANHPLASSGWRPIVGDRYEKRGQIIPEASNIAPQIVPQLPQLPQIPQFPQQGLENNQNRNGQIPNNNHQRIKPEGPKNAHQQFNQESGLKPPLNQNVEKPIRGQKEPVKGQVNHNNNNFMKNQGNPGKIRVNHHGSTGHHNKQLPKPINQKGPKPMSQMHMSKGPMRHSPPKGNSNGHKRPTKKQPYRTQATAHSQKEEIIAPAPSSGIGSYTYFNQGPFNIRDTQIGDRKPFNQDFRNHFIQGSNSEVVPQLHHFGFGKHPSQNELHNSNLFFNQNDEYTRNLVPPPPAKQEVKEAEKQIVLPQNKQFLLKPKDERFPFNYDRPLDLEITKERIREFHTTAAPPIFSKGTTETYSTIKFTNKPIHFNHGYEVTEDKRWQESSPFYQFSRPTTPVRLQTYPTLLPELQQNYQETTQFLPTPFIETFPTINPQEVSTVYSEVAKYRNQNYQPNHYNIKEVATHFPIFEVKAPNLQQQPTTRRPTTTNTPQTEMAYVTTQEPITPKPTRRQNLRRRRPIRPTTEEVTEPVEVSSERTVEVSSERPVRRRRPMKQRTTESYNEDVTKAPRRRPKPQIEEEQENYPPNFFKKEEIIENYPQVKAQVQETRFEESVQETTTEYPRPTALQYSDEPSDVETTTKRKRLRTTTEDPEPTSFKFENEIIEYTTASQEVTTEEPQTSTILTTRTTTTTEPTTKTHRIRRPSKYDSLRPRFSVKDYKQKLIQTSSTTEINKITTPATIGRIKYPSRFTKEPNSKEDDTEMLRFRFKPKDPRHRGTTEPISAEVSSTTERYKVNRVRPFGRTRTTESTTTTTPKVSIKPNIFTNLKRPQTPGLRTRILNKKNVTTTEAPVTESIEEVAEVTLPVAENHMESTTESFRRILDNTPDYEEDENEGEKSPDDAEAFLQLQRITELTSQAKNDHFKTMSTASRRVPSYFTISTDDPILPIEAFFSKINQ